MDILKWALRTCRKAESWLLKFEEQKPVDKPAPYDTLAPKTINDESMQEYFSALSYAFSQSDVRNVAVTGNYGAGKSTIISSFMKYHCSQKYINVSLAGFEMTEKNDIVGPVHQEIELSILQQILYKENRSALPDSRIDRIQNKDRLHTLRTYAALLKIAIPAALFSGVLFFKTISDFLNLPNDWSVALTDNYSLKVLLLTIFAFTSLYFITDCATKIGIFDKKIKLSKIAFLSGDVEVSEKEASSLLNNCLDEIVYFFSRLNYKFVIFEDLDRLGTPDIFVKLREINKIINNNINDDNPVRFIYAVRDDVFSGADARTKFFDFILPVVSFMDSRNAFTLLKKKMGLHNENDTHLKNLSLYINDMRSLQNIINEYQIFRKVVDNSAHDIRLLSIVFYKNIFALDYNLSDKKTGVLYSFIRDYRTRNLHHYHFNLVENKLSALNEKLDAHTKYHDISKEQIRKSILSRFIPDFLWDTFNFYYKNGYNLITCNNDILLNSESDFENFLATQNIYAGNGSNYKEISKETKEKSLKEYEQRTKLLTDKSHDDLNNLNNEIVQTKETLRTKNAISLSDLIRLLGRDKFGELAQTYLVNMERHDYVSSQQFATLKSDMHNGGLDALFVLLTDGLILQDYMSYRSIFHAGAMSVNDNDFIKAVGQDLDCETSNINYFIDDAQTVLQELIDQNRIYADGALHHQLITFLVNSHSEYLSGIISSLFQRTNDIIIKNLFTLYEKIETPETFEKFISIALIGTGYLDKAISVIQGNRHNEYFIDIAITIISKISPENTKNINTYREFVKSHGVQIFRAMNEEQAKRYMQNTLDAKVIYDELSYPTLPVQLYCIKFIANHNLYRLTIENVAISISCILHDKKIGPEYASKKPWSIAEKHNLTSVTEYFKENIEIFIMNVFIFTQEDSLCIYNMLIYTPMSNKAKLAIVRKMKFHISDLNKFSATSFNEDEENGSGLSIRDHLFINDRVKPSWPLLIDYISDECNSDAMNGWLSKHASELGALTSPLCDDKNHISLYEKIICNSKLDETTYANVLSSIDIDKDQIDEELNTINFSRLITMKKITLDEEIYSRVFDFHPQNTPEIINTYIIWFSQFKTIFLDSPDIFLQKTKNKTFFEVIISNLMLSKLFSIEEKVNLIIYFTDYYKTHDVSDLNLPQEVSLLAIESSEDIELKTLFIAYLISTGYRIKNRLAELCLRINEGELASVFVNSSQATIAANDDTNVSLILKHAQRTKIIRSFEIRTDGKYEVNIRRDKEI